LAGWRSASANCHACNRRTARWSVDRVSAVFNLPFANYLYVERAQLLLIPTARNLADEMASVDRAEREARSDALIIRLPDPRSGLLELALGRWTFCRKSMAGADEALVPP
jgi:hypothetical protein